MGAPQVEPDAVAILDLVECVLMDLACFFNPFLQGCHNPQRKCGRQLSQVLQKTYIFIVGPCISLGRQELREFIY